MLSLARSRLSWLTLSPLSVVQLSVGSVRTKNAKNILMMILLDAGMCAIAWFFLGFGFAFGQDNFGQTSFGFIGVGNFVGIGVGAVPDVSAAGKLQYASYEFWFFEYAFAATAATIVSGAVAERAKFEAYLSYSFVLSLWVYPVVAHWVWGGGFLTAGPSSLGGVGCLDFAGDGPVHMVGGVAGAIAGKLIGPRIGRFDSEGNPTTIPGHSSPLAFLGTFILWVGWLGFNAGSGLFIASPSDGVAFVQGGGTVAGRAAVNTILSSATGGLFAIAMKAVMVKSREWDINAALNGILAGLVAITGGCAFVEMWAALVIGLIAGPYYVLMSDFTAKVLKIDDPLDATPVHLFTGALGLIMVGFFANPAFVEHAFPAFLQGGDPKNYAGIFYGGNGHLLGVQVVEIVVVFAWVSAFMTPYFLFLRKMAWFRVSAEVEHLGIDESSHGGTAYPTDGYEPEPRGNRGASGPAPATASPPASGISKV
jgi:Amt family ammonium transporter